MATIEEMIWVIGEGRASADLIQTLLDRPAYGPEGEILVKSYLRLVLSEAEEAGMSWKLWSDDKCMGWAVGYTNVYYYGDIEEGFSADQLTDEMMDSLIIKHLTLLL